MKMTKEAISLHSLNKTLNRIENKLQTLENKFKELDSTLEKLTQKFEIQGTSLEEQVSQDEMWTSLLEDRFTSVEIKLFYSYVSETISCLHNQVTQKLPDLARSLPTLASILRRKSKNQRIRLVWESVLESLGLQEGHVRALCTFFITHSFEAQYYPVYSANQRQKYTGDIITMITKVVKNQMLQESLLCAVQVVENGKAEKKVAWDQ
ncbi:single-pass membrane and coiled-coil domain-containing protein 1 isoform X1 [Alligator sinensis]|uniref:Single-pass membrane and coiled-coil domain-containing protein 1 isoform X1 n=1 Tax=Alligator sinensis TaxID=38654 RepID=A0A3Q0FNS7_ALLSI|nr:single-pass membrane and coiled-coil domain-containing protein 1 isoform X1 [Alligator sinensis]